MPRAIRKHAPARSRERRPHPGPTAIDVAAFFLATAIAAVALAAEHASASAAWLGRVAFFVLLIAGMAALVKAARDETP
jgi:hypothetical protein